MKNFRAIIIDDENKAGALLQSLILELCKQVEVVSVYQDARIALEELDVMNPDLVFLDIEMPHLNGFEFLKSVKDVHFEVIFVTGYDEYALEAFKVSATDYLLKPISSENLIDAVAKAEKSIQSKLSNDRYKVLIENLKEKTSSNRKIGIPSMNGIDFVTIDDIAICEGDQKYTNVILENGDKILSSYNIGEFNKILESAGFFLSHRSFLINLSKIRQYQKDGTIVLDNGMTAPLARRRKEEFFTLINKV